MSTSSRRKSLPESRDLAAVLAPDFIEVLAKRIPNASRATVEATGCVIAAVGAAAAKLSTKQLKIIYRQTDELIFQILNVKPNLVELKPKGPVRVLQGEGLGEIISHEEGLRRLHDYATPMKIEDWAGPVAGPTKLQQDYDIRRSTLHTWQQQNAVIGLLSGRKKHVYPLAQFVDGRPVPGIAAVMHEIEAPRVAWMWLIQPHPSAKGTPPLERLKRGAIAEVVEMANGDFGQP